jgi:phage terminase large subunit-like protein
LIEYLTRDELERLSLLTVELNHRWETWARNNQLPPPGDWTTWLILAGRGFGKTRTGAEWVKEQVRLGKCGRLALVAEDAGDARDVMVEGESGILAISHPDRRPHYEPSKRRLTWPNGAQATLYAAADPEALRGPQHDGAWCDELAKWQYAEDTWNNLMMGLRLGPKPQCVVTTTPKPIPLIKRLLKDVEGGMVAVSRGSTYENLDNLSPAFRSIISRYEGTRLGRQELDAEVLEDVEGALWTLANIDANRVNKAPDEMLWVSVGVDPAVTSNKDSDETGIVVAGRAWCNCKGALEKHYFVLQDATVGIVAPSVWAAASVNAYHNHQANVIAAEVNNGGDLIQTLIRGIDGTIPVRKIHASRGKLTRAEPVSMLYEQGKVHHVGAFPALEDQMCTYVAGAGDSPDRMDALVFALVELSRMGGQAA